MWALLLEEWMAMRLGLLGGSLAVFKDGQAQAAKTPALAAR